MSYRDDDTLYNRAIILQRESDLDELSAIPLALSLR